MEAMVWDFTHLEAFLGTPAPSKAAAVPAASQGRSLGRNATLVGPVGTGPGRARSPQCHLQKPFACFGLGVTLINHSAVKILSQCSLGEGGHSRENRFWRQKSHPCPGPSHPRTILLLLFSSRHGADSAQEYFQAMGK